MTGKPPARTWHLAGCGAIGTLFAGRLQALGIDLAVPAEALRAALPADTLHRTLIADGRAQRIAIPIAPRSSADAIEQLLVTTKAWAVAPVLAALAPRFAPGARVLLLCNGMGFDEGAAPMPRGLELLRGVTTHGALRLSAGRVRHTGNGTTYIGAPGTRGVPGTWFDRSFGRLPDCRWDTDITRRLWAKLAINAVINPLTARYRVRNGELLNDPGRRRSVDQLCREVSEILAAAGHGDCVPDLAQQIADVLARTAANESSTLQDVRAGRRTEIPWINGYLDRLAAASGVTAPLNHAITGSFR